MTPLVTQGPNGNVCMVVSERDAALITRLLGKLPSQCEYGQQLFAKLDQLFPIAKDNKDGPSAKWPYDELGYPASTALPPIQMCSALHTYLNLFRGD